MFKPNHFSKENINDGNCLLSEDTLRNKYSTQRPSKNVSNAKTPKHQNLFNLNVEDGLKEDNAVLNESSTPSSFSKFENKVKLRKKDHKENLSSEKNTVAHRKVLGDRSNVKLQNTHKTPKKLKVNKSDLKLKSPVSKQSLAFKSKNNEHWTNSNSTHFLSGDNDKTFAYFEEKLNTFRNLKKNSTCRADREAFNVFSFPSKDIRTPNIVGMGSITKSGSVQVKKNLNIRSLSLNNNPVTTDMNRTDAEETKSKLDDPNTRGSTKVPQISFETINNEEKIYFLEEPQFCSPILGNKSLTVGSDTNPASPILDSKVSKSLQFKTDNLHQPPEFLLSPILSTNVGSCKEMPNVLAKRRQNVLLKKDEVMCCSQIVCSPILGSSQYKKEMFMHKLKPVRCNSLVKPKIDEDFSPSPVLSSSQFKKPNMKLKNVLVRKNKGKCSSLHGQSFSQNNDSAKLDLLYNSEEITTKERQECSFKIKKAIDKESAIRDFEHKTETNDDVLCDSVVILNNKSSFINQPKSNTQGKVSEQLSQVLDCDQSKSSSNSILTKLRSNQMSTNLTIVSESDIFPDQNTSTVKQTVCGLKDNGKEKKDELYFSRIALLCSHDELAEFCSPVLDSSQFKRKCSEKQAGAQVSKHQESLSKSCESNHSPEIANHGNQSMSQELKTDCDEECNENSNVLNNILPPNKPISSSIPAQNFKTHVSSYNRSEPSNFLPNKCISNFASQKPVHPDECHLSPSISKQKRTCSPITDSNTKHKKQKTEIFRKEVEHNGPMLSLITKSPFSDDGFCPNTLNLDEEENLACSPSFNSDLDIRKFPIMLSDLTNQCSPNEVSKETVPGKNCDSIVRSQGNVKEKNVGLVLKDSSRGKIESNILNKSRPKLLSVLANLSTELSSNLSCHKSEPMSPVLSKSSSYNNTKLSVKPSGNDRIAVIEKGETSKSKESEFSERENSRSNAHSGNQETTRKNVKKNLAFYYEEVKPLTLSTSNEIANINENIITTTKAKETFDDEELAFGSQISGVGKLQTLVCDYADSEKLMIICDPENNTRQKSPPMFENELPNHKSVNSLERSITNENKQDVNISNNVTTESQQKLHWKNKLNVFDDNEEIHIEEFDEESPSQKDNVESTIDINKRDTIKRNLNGRLEQNPPLLLNTKQAVPEVNSLLPNFESNSQRKNTCENVTSDEESICEVEIQEFSQRTSERSPAFRIDYSTTPTIKSSEETQNEVVSNPPSFPPALDAKTNTSPDAVLDSACKNRRTKVKRGSVVERLRRLVRGQRAEVNMFHHEASGLREARSRACSLYVTSATQTCSLLLLDCRYTDARRMSSQEFSSGEEVVDPQVHVYADPSYAKNITAGSTVTIFPPWHSVWYESRGVVVMYCVTKLQLTPQNHPLPGGRRYLTSHSNAACTTEQEFSCQFRDDHCSCRSHLVEQLFTAPPQSRGPVQSAGGADGAITAALAGGLYPRRVRLVLTVLHCFKTRCRFNQVQTRLLCVDPSGCICQLNFRSELDLLKLGPLKEALYKTFILKNLTVSRRIFIDRCKGLRSFLSYLRAESTSQQILYVATPSSDEWTAQLINESADALTSADSHSRTTSRLQQLLTLPVDEDVEGRARAKVRVMAVRRDELFAWEPRLDSYFKLNITSSAAMPNFPARACLELLYLWAHQGELTIDKFTEVSVIEAEDGDSPTIPSLAVNSIEGSLVLLDSIVTKVSSEAYLRWEGSCGHKVLRVQKTGMFFCSTCRQTSASSTQNVVLEVCVAVVDFPHPIRVKVKSETARVLLADTSGQISSEKSYNMIGVIGSTLKCLAVVTEVLKNTLGDIIEFILEEL